MFSALPFPEHHHLILEHNPHRGVYESVAVYTDPTELGDWVSDWERRWALSRQSLWTLQWYPQTPVGFHKLYAADLEPLLKAALEVNR